MPPGLSTSPLPINGPIPGIPTNVTTLPKGTSPTPGIPSEKELKRGIRPTGKPTPGIPSQEEIRKALGQPPTGTNVKPPSNVPMMKSNRNLGGKPQ